MAFLVLLPIFVFWLLRVFFVVCVFCCSMLSLPCDYSCVVVGVYEERTHHLQIFLPEGDFRDETPLHFPLGGENPKLHMATTSYIRMNYFRSHEIRIPIDHRNFHCFHVTGGEFSRCWFQLFLGSLTPKIGEMILTDVLSRGASHHIPTRFKDSRHLVQVCELQTLSHCVFIVGKVFLVL